MTLSLILMTLPLKKWKLILFSLSTMLPLSFIKIPLHSSTYMYSNFLTMDLMTFCLISLSILITTLMLLASSNIKININLFTFLIMTLLFFLLLTFLSPNMILFYISFETTIIPTFLIITYWGIQPERLSSTLYLIFYTLGASIPLLLILMKLNNQFMTLSFWMMSYIQPNLPFLWILILLGAFLVKLPMFMIHLWLPKAHVEAPLAGSMILAAVLLKLGGYGLMRMFHLFYKSLNKMIPILMSISLMGGIITGILCIMQTDMKALVAYSSVCHMSLLLGGAITLTQWGTSGAMSMMISHGLCSSSMFQLVTLLYSSTHTRSLILTRGMLSLFPSLILWWFLMSANNMAAPPSMNLFSEISLLMGLLSWSYLILIPFMMISFISASYSLILFSTTSHGLPLMNSPQCNFYPRDYLSIFLHWLPLNILIIKMDLMMMWP
uniref:NADH-ubiquinone oxidoreductase chain 4 n=1 Tax=Tityus serrulatus TaxID=6887 RepID=A0A0K1LW86_TITSE|nr:NADH dehydrogenase subunit 4 [Tityus serrulatus]AKU46797.1 NADH dehydrogenase subunit 4 [Tityus serrulatus]